MYSVGDGAAFLEGRQAESLELLPHPTDADANHQPAPGQHVQSGQRLRRHQRIPVRHDDDAGDQPDSGGLPSQESQQRQLLHRLSRRAARKLAALSVRIRRGDVPGHQDVIAGEQGVVAKFLARASDAAQRFRRRQRAPAWQRKPVLHISCSC